MSDIWRDLRQLLSLSANISGKLTDIDKQKTALSVAILSALNKKFVNFGPLTEVIGAHVDPP